MTATGDKLPLTELDQLEVERVEAETRRALLTKRAAAKLLGEGPVYQGVAKQIRWLEASGAEGKDGAGGRRDPVIDGAQYAGVIAAARATARALDRATGHNLTGWHANGRDLAPLAERLESLLTILAGNAPETDEFQLLLDAMKDTPAPLEVPGHAP